MYAMKPKNKTGTSRMPIKARIALSILYYDIDTQDALDLVRRVKSVVGDVLIGTPEQVISRIPQTINDGLGRNDPQIVGIITGFGIDLGLSDFSQQNLPLIEQNCREYLASLTK